MAYKTKIKQPVAAANTAAIYCRVSTDAQAREGVSLQVQEDRLMAYCLARGLDVTKVYIESGVSGSIDIRKRPQGSLLCEDLQAGRVQHVVALKLDRLFRSVSNASDLAQQWRSYGRALHLVDQNIDTNSATGLAMFQMMAVFAELERSMIAERTTSGWMHKRAIGQAFNHDPLGFQKVDTLEGGKIVKKLVRVESEIATVSRIFQETAAGVSMHAIARDLRADGVPTKRGGQWSAETIKSVLHGSTLREEMLTLAA